MPIGSMTFEDIYGAGSLDTLPAGGVGETQKKVNPNDSNVTGVVKKDKTGIFNVQGNFLGQPIAVYIGLFALLFLLKYFVEMKG